LQVPDYSGEGLLQNPTDAPKDEQSFLIIKTKKMKKRFLIPLILITVTAGLVSFITLPPTSYLSEVKEQEIFLGTETDQCSGSLSVKNKNGQFVAIPRGKTTVVDVAIDGDGYWRWRCGNTNERSRGVPNYRQRVKRLKVLHSKNSREITWRCFDIN
jgi:hypothetical protein